MHNNLLLHTLRSRKESLKCAQCIKRSKCVVSHKQIKPKTFFSDNKYRQNIYGRLRGFDTFLAMFCQY